MYISGFLNGCVMSYSKEHEVGIEDLPQHIVLNTPERAALLNIIQVLVTLNHFKAADEVHGTLETGVPPSTAKAEELYEEHVAPYYEYPEKAVKGALQGIILTQLLVADGERTAQTLASCVDFELMEETVSEFGDSPTSLESREIYIKLMQYVTSMIKEEMS
jgi:hypothetical protein